MESLASSVDDERRVDELVVDAPGDGRLGEAGADTRSHVGDGSRAASNFFWLPSGSVMTGMVVFRNQDQAVGRSQHLPKAVAAESIPTTPCALG